MTAQPFGCCHCGGECQDAFGSTHPDQSRRRQSERSVECEVGGQAGDCHRQQPAERFYIDQKRVTDPIEAGEKIPEPEAPACQCRRYRTTETARRCAVDEPDQQREGDEQNRPRIDWSHCQCRRSAGHECNCRAPPAGGENDEVGEAGDRHERGVPVVGLASLDAAVSSVP